jgi:hypothetical protein
MDGPYAKSIEPLIASILYFDKYPDVALIDECP